MRIAFITAHHPNSPRRTGFHFWAEILAKRGDDVDWITVGQSRLSHLRGKTLTQGPFNQWTSRNKIYSFTWLPFFHPINVKPQWLNTLLSDIYKLYPSQMPEALINRIKAADFVIVEAGPGLMLIPKLAPLCPSTRFIYFASDRLETLGAHPAIIAAEKAALPHFSLIRVISEPRLKDYPSHSRVRYISQGIDKTFFESSFPNPYQTSRNIICAGDMLFDAESVSIIARLLPEWRIHLFGRNAHLKQKMENVIEYGERPFEEVASYIRHADFAIAPYLPTTGGDYFAQSSLKIAQYTYCRLPVLVPDTIKPTQKHLIPYQPGNKADIARALKIIMEFEAKTIDTSIPDWETVLDTILFAAKGQA